MGQDEGFLGRMVGGMIRRSVRARFHSVHWIPPLTPLTKPLILVPNHHGWHDGYLMYHALTALETPFLDWVQEFDAFPLFARVGGMPFPVNDAAGRAKTIRQTIRRMNEERRSLLLFAEGVLHYPPELMPFGKSLELVASKVPGVTVLPVAIRYEMAMHERPEAFIGFGEPVPLGPDLAVRTRIAVQRRLGELIAQIRINREPFQLLAKGTLDVNERWDMRNRPGNKQKL